MKEVKHSPTPWRVGDHDQNDQSCIYAADGQFIAVIVHECLTARLPEMDANAAHIVKCVNERDELIAALKAILRDATPMTLVEGVSAHVVESEIIEAACRVLKKAGIE